MRPPFAAFCLALTIALPATADDGPIPMPGSADEPGWHHQDFFGIRAARFEGKPDGALEIRTEDATSILYRELGHAGAAGHLLRWQWKVDQAPPPTDLSRKGGDDRALTLHLYFSPDGNRGGLFGWGAHGKAITYVWGGDHPAGTVIPNPYFDDGVIIVLESSNAPLGVWRDAAVNWQADYRAAFGEDPPLPTHLGLSADSDDTDTSSLGYFRDLRFTTP